MKGLALVDPENTAVLWSIAHCLCTVSHLAVLHIQPNAVTYFSVYFGSHFINGMETSLTKSYLT